MLIIEFQLIRQLSSAKVNSNKKKKQKSPNLKRFGARWNNNGYWIATMFIAGAGGAEILHCCAHILILLPSRIRNPINEWNQSTNHRVNASRDDSLETAFSGGLNYVHPPNNAERPPTKVYSGIRKRGINLNSAPMLIHTTNEHDKELLCGSQPLFATFVPSIRASAAFLNFAPHHLDPASLAPK